MIVKRFTKSRLVKAVFGCLFGIIGIFGGMMAPVDPVYAVPAEEAVDENVTETNDGSAESTKKVAESVSCDDTLGSLAWLACPGTGAISKATDFLYEKIESILVINPVEMKDGEPVYEIWKYAKGVANIVFIGFLLVVVYSQITGMGINNYGIKKILPKLIVAAVLVNLSFIICSLAVDVSNIIGGGVRGLFTSIGEATVGTSGVPESVRLSEIYASIGGGTLLTIGAVAIMWGTGTIWMLIATVIGAVVAVVIGLVTIAMRQAVVMLLIMISPLAVVAYMLPNTEKWFKMWKNLLMRMLVFYPLFSLLFGASALAGWAIIASAKEDGFMVILGVAVQTFPLFFSWSLMKMSGTVLGTINSKLTALASKPLAQNRAWAESRRDAARAKALANGVMPYARLTQYMNNRRIAREEEMDEHKKTAKNRGLAYAAMRNYKDKDGKVLSREGERAFDSVIRNVRYGRIIDRHKDNFEEGVGGLSGGDAKRKARLDILDARIIKESDLAAAEKERGERIAYNNAMGRHQRMEDAVNAHFDSENEGRKDYKRHNIQNRDEALERYDAVRNVMGGNAEMVQYVAASAAQAYDTQKKIVETKMQKYFELTPPTKDVEYRLSEFTMRNNAVKNIDSIIAGLRILNQRGDTDLVKAQIDNLLDKNIGGGLTLGTHASQSLASFLMFEVKDNDPFLRRFGKYINLETAKVYNSNERKVESVTYDEYVKGYHDGEIDLVSESNPTGRMYTKKAMKQLVEGTSLDNVERTAFANLDDSLKKAYGYDAKDKSKSWDIDGWLRKREEIQTAFEPAFLSASLKWLSGSEQINSGVKFWTGYEQKQKKENGQVVTDENGDPVYELTPVWKSGEFAGKEKDVEAYYRKKSNDYFKDQTTGQILGMRTDYRDPTMEHLVESYLGSDSGGESSSEKRRKYEKARAEIQTRYADKRPEEAEKLRNKDIKELKMDLAGRQLRKILGETGKLKQIYSSRRSGVANNAKDWLRRWVNLDNEEALRKEVGYYDELQRREYDEEIQRRREADPNFEYEPVHRTYSVEDQSRFLAEMSNANEDYKDESPEVFFNKTRDKLSEWFADDYAVWSYEKYYEHNPNADNDDLYSWLRNLLEDLDQYPGNRDSENR